MNILESTWRQQLPGATTPNATEASGRSFAGLWSYASAPTKWLGSWNGTNAALGVRR